MTDKSVLQRKHFVKHIYTIILPDSGKHIIIGAYYEEAQARKIAKKKMAHDFLEVCTYPVQRRILEPNETVKFGEEYK